MANTRRELCAACALPKLQPCSTLSRKTLIRHLCLPLLCALRVGLFLQKRSAQGQRSPGVSDEPERRLTGLVKCSVEILNYYIAIKNMVETKVGSLTRLTSSIGLRNRSNTEAKQETNQMKKIALSLIALAAVSTAALADRSQTCAHRHLYGQIRQRGHQLREAVDPRF